MKVIFDTKFRKIIKKRFPKSSMVRYQFTNRLKMFIDDPKNDVLKCHKLTGKMAGLNAMSVNGDVRAIYYMKCEDVACFIDIGTHSQVYGK
ncbi:hypothetical protein COU93_02695 [Candidatus Shapirobacteria bacterium CG10_big_fil_rev_8_21_14_0_10_36_6]|uniref:Type II toxin-antitoxin system mRNA interferase toxin, RelE/StbE family n=1 Tax=Candidatus Shapirobacteria bacterium CG10_big_fil_rev_8_21_14_0_10_36_6 TaxID=1974886 RepID=A0A2M8L1G7_9BACT|nr:MAG: hypothetical protein COU93_02695 [Candidatus Shapirobacteria bacterium CG10_big_fil_rev_8_21_14_0_10_36_6]